MHLCLVEDNLSRNFRPLTWFRPVYDLRCGMLSLRERAEHWLNPRSVSLHTRQSLVSLVKEEFPKNEVGAVSPASCLVLSGRCIVDADFVKAVKKARTDCVFTSGGEVVAALVSERMLGLLLDQIENDEIDLSGFRPLPEIQVETKLVRFPWDLVYANETTLESDFNLLTRKSSSRSGKADIHKGATLVGKKRIHIGTRSQIDAGVVLDAGAGPIYIGRNVHIYPHAVIEGPCFVGDGSIIKIGAKIYGNTSIGISCKVGGEVEHAILHSHSNKQHDGYLGHSYLGQWVNLGAGTTTSNLKNTYGNVSIRVGDKLVDSGRMFLGTISGDHVKTGINVSLDTGTVIGPSSNLFGARLLPKFIPSFSWGESGAITTYEPQKAFDVAVKVMARRNVQGTVAYREVFHEVFNRTENERSANRK
ncbi:MAG: putative sugar nucleotidyl transferase [Bacteroidota bacterium]